MTYQRWEESYVRSRRNLKVRQRRVQSFGISRESRILDFGCGDGLDLVAFHNLSYQNVVGLDNSASLLSRIQAFPKVMGDAYNTPFPSSSFDIVFVNSVLHHLDVPIALREIRRILKPSGELCLIEPVNSLLRQILDLVALSYLFRPFRYIPFFRLRRVWLQVEILEYRRWLRHQKAFPSILKGTGFDMVFARRSLMSLFVKCRVKDNRENLSRSLLLPSKGRTEENTSPSESHNTKDDNTND